MVTVITPCYRQAHFLPQAVRSVLGQTLAKLELIVVDDGSPDDVMAAMAPFLDDPRVTFVQQDNCGLGATRNRVLAMARGRYVNFLDADDWLAPDKLERQVAALEAEPDVGMAYSDFFHAHEATGELEAVPANLIGMLQDDPLVHYWARFTLPPVALLVRRTWLEGLRFRTELPVAEDADLWLRLIAVGCPLRYVAGHLAYYRQHGRSLTKQGTLTDAHVRIRRDFMVDFPDAAAGADDAAFRRANRQIDGNNWELRVGRSDVAAGRAHLATKEAELAELHAAHRQHVQRAAFHYGLLQADCARKTAELAAARAAMDALDGEGLG